MTVLNPDALPSIYETLRDSSRLTGQRQPYMPTQPGFGGGRGILPGEMDFGRPPMRQPYFPPRQQPMPRGYRNPYAPSPFYQQRFDRYAPMMPQGGGGGRYGNQNMGSIWGGGMGQVIPTNIPFRDQGYGSPMLSQNLIQSLSGPNNLMNPYRRDTTLDMLGRFRGGGGGWGGMRNDPYYDRWGGGGYPPVYDDGGGYPPEEEVVAKAVEVEVKMSHPRRMALHLQRLEMALHRILGVLTAPILGGVKLPTTLIQKISGWLMGLGWLKTLKANSLG